MQPDECRQNAAECLSLAEGLKNDEAAIFLRGLAERWLRLAEHLERTAL